MWVCLKWRLNPPPFEGGILWYIMINNTVGFGIFFLQTHPVIFLWFVESSRSAFESCIYCLNGIYNYTEKLLYIEKWFWFGHLQQSLVGTTTNFAGLQYKIITPDHIWFFWTLAAGPWLQMMPNCCTFVLTTSTAARPQTWLQCRMELGISNDRWPI